MQIKTEEISLSILKQKKVRLFVKRIDQVYNNISGNKYYKLKYNLLEAKRQSAKSLLTFGGAYSNHILATAYAAKENGFKSIGIIRGEERLPLNPTLALAIKNGMKLYYISRKDYRLKSTINFLNKLHLKFSNFYLIPEGGTNELAIQGAQEILDLNDNQDYICCAVGTGGTMAGIINSKRKYQKIIGFPAIKGFDLLHKEIEKWSNNNTWELLSNCESLSYGSINKVLVNFINMFYKTQKIPLDALYNGKMLLSIIDLIEKNYFPKGSSILAINTGGLQGNKGINKKFEVELPVNYNE